MPKYATARNDLGALVRFRPRNRCESHKREPTCSTATRPSATQLDSYCRSGASSSTQPDGDRTPGIVLDFPDTEEVTGSNPVRPTPFFEILSSA